MALLDLCSRKAWSGLSQHDRETQGLCMKWNQVTLGRHPTTFSLLPSKGTFHHLPGNCVPKTGNPPNRKNVCNALPNPL
jgi:hypothetical protein